MAMEVKPAKQLTKHTIPVVMAMLALLALPAAALAFYKADNPKVETAIAHGLVTRVIHIRPTANGLDGLAQTGHTAELSLSSR
jgi:hypothetical protein